MGMWGSGKFESDTALDHLDIVVNELLKPLREGVENPMLFEVDEYHHYAALCNLELLVTWIEKYGYIANYIKLDELDLWEKSLLTVFDQTESSMWSSKAFGLQRRRVIVGTFERLRVLIKIQLEEKGFSVNGNFDNNWSVDYIQQLVDGWLAIIKKTMKTKGTIIDPDEYYHYIVLCNIELVAYLGERYESCIYYNVSIKKIKKWKKKMLKIYDRFYEQLGESNKDDVVKRRKVIAHTFDKLSLVVLKQRVGTTKIYLI